MMLLGRPCRLWNYLAGQYPGSVGVLTSPSRMTKVPLDEWMPFALDNDAYAAWRDNKPWDVQAWRDMLQRIRLKHLSPMWAAVPDVVGDREATILKWSVYADEIMERGWKTAFCVQDGMTHKDVPRQADVVFVGGTDGWKFPNLPMWTDNFPCVHCGRVNSPEMIEACERLGCASVDGTGWFKNPNRQDQLPAIKRFVEGHRDSSHPTLALTTASIGTGRSHKTTAQEGRGG